MKNAPTLIKMFQWIVYFTRYYLSQVEVQLRIVIHSILRLFGNGSSNIRLTMDLYEEIINFNVRSTHEKLKLHLIEFRNLHFFKVIAFFVLVKLFCILLDVEIDLAH